MLQSNGITPVTYMAISTTPNIGQQQAVTKNREIMHNFSCEYTISRLSKKYYCTLVAPRAERIEKSNNDECNAPLRFL